MRSREHARAAGDAGAVAARLADHGRRLAGHGRLVDRGDALDDLAVGRDHVARLADDAVAGAQIGRRARLLDVAGAEQARDRGRARLAQALGLGLAAALGERLGEVGEQHGQPQPDRDLEPRTATAWPWAMSTTSCPVTSTETTHTERITGLRSRARGSSLRTESSRAARAIAGSSSEVVAGGHQSLPVSASVRGPSARAGKKERAPTSRITPISRPTKIGEAGRHAAARGRPRLLRRERPGEAERGQDHEEAAEHHRRAAAGSRSSSSPPVRPANAEPLLFQVDANA